MTTASRLIQQRSKAWVRHGISMNDKARLDVINGHGSLSNTVSIAFWTLYYILFDSMTLQSVRNAVETLLHSEEKGCNVARHEIDIRKIREVLILKSLMYKTLRYYYGGSQRRFILEDSSLSDRYMLRKNSLVITPRHSVHFDIRA